MFCPMAPSCPCGATNVLHMLVLYLIAPFGGFSTTTHTPTHTHINKTIKCGGFTTYRAGNNFIRFTFRHFAIFSRFSTQISDQVGLKLPVLSPKLHTRLLF